MAKSEVNDQCSLIIVSSDLRTCVLDAEVKRGAELSTDQHFNSEHKEGKMTKRVFFGHLAKAPVLPCKNSLGC